MRNAIILPVLLLSALCACAKREAVTDSSVPDVQSVQMAQVDTSVADATPAREARVDIAALAAWARTKDKGEARAYAPDDKAPPLKASPKTPSDVEMIALLQKSAAASAGSLAVQAAQTPSPRLEDARLESAQLTALTARIPNERMEPARAASPTPLSPPDAVPARQAPPAKSPIPHVGDADASWVVTMFRFQRGADTLSPKAIAALAHTLEPHLNEAGLKIELAAGLAAGAALDDLLIANRRLAALAKSIPSQMEVTRRFDPQVPLDAIEIRLQSGRL